MSTPIIIIGFDRHDYLDRFCASLKAQKEYQVLSNDIHFVQDGARSKRTGCNYTSQEKLDRCKDVFFRHFPDANFHPSSENLGIALNFERAEKLAFRHLRAEVAYFFEDDMVLGDHYLSVLDQIRLKVEHLPNAGYFACYGDFTRQSDIAHPKFVPLEHHWGFGLTRKCWEAMQTWIEPFYNIYRSSDYKWRPHLTILKCFEGKDVAWGETSQDVVKTAACASLGFARINTDVCFARYIGIHGQSFNEQTFNSLGFDKAPLVDEKPSSLPEMNEEILKDFAAHKREAMHAFRRNELPGRISQMSERMFEPDRIATREDVINLWKYIMDRLPGEDFFESNVGKVTVRRIRIELLRSDEARGKSSYS